MVKKFFLSSLLLLSFHLTADEVYPVAIVGGGIGGLTAGIYLGRANVKNLIIEGPKPGGALAQSPSVQNWPGELDISGYALMEKIRGQAEKSGCAFSQEEVIGVDFSKRPFVLKLRDPFEPSKIRTISAKQCIIATGANPKLLGIPGEDKYWAKGVYSCALCDGSLYQDKIVAVVGGGDSAVLESQYLSKIAKKVHLFVRKPTLRGVEETRREEVMHTPNIEIHYQTTIEEVKGDNEGVNGLIVKDKNGNSSSVATDALFLAIGATPNTEMFKGQVELDVAGYVVLKDHQKTSVDGVLAIGDVTGGICKQAVCAASEGAIASVQIENAKPIAAADEVVEITSEEQLQREIESSNSVVYIDFYATWCGPCKQLKPRFDNWAKALRGKNKFLKVNVDKVRGLSEKYKIRAMPTMIVLDEKGNVITRKEGTLEICKHMDSTIPVQ